MRSAKFAELFLERYPQHESAPRVAYGIATSLQQAGELEEAIEAYRAVVAKFPKRYLPATRR